MVSIVLPTYNGQKYIEESVRSIIRQTYTDWELIIVDDCSTDGTPGIADAFAQEDSRITVIHNKVNAKLPEALNIGFRKAKGEYLTWTSDDNMYLEFAFEAMSRYLDTHPEHAMVCTKMIWVDENLRFIKEHQIYDEKVMHIDDVVGASFMYRREILNEVGEYDSDMFCVEDYEYWVRILESGNKIGFLDGTYYIYREHKESLSVAKKDNVIRQQRRLYLRHLDWILDGIKENTTYLTYLYNELIKCSEVKIEDIKRKISKYIPIIEYDESPIQFSKLYLYGAGEVGQKALDFVRNRVVAFIDSNPKKWGEKIEGIEIISLDDAVTQLKSDIETGIIVSVGSDKQYEIINNIVSHGIRKYSVAGHLGV